MNHFDPEADITLAAALLFLAVLVGAIAFLLAMGGALVWRHFH